MFFISILIYKRPKATHPQGGAECSSGFAVTIVHIYGYGWPRMAQTPVLGTMRPNLGESGRFVIIEGTL
jgi:hypothetical protein